MNQVLSHKLWRRIAEVARKARRRQAAIAYVSSDLVGFKAGDLLIVDASEPIIRSGGTNAKLLAQLARKGVEVRNCPGLHAKVLLMDHIVVVGSGNMSASSRSQLVEAAIMTDAAPVVSGVASVIEQHRRQSAKLDKETLGALAKIEVVRRGFGLGGATGTKHKRPRIAELGDRTWLVGVIEYDRERAPSSDMAVGMTATTSNRCAASAQPACRTGARWDPQGNRRVNRAGARLDL